jgi:hypothetical protein
LAARDLSQFLQPRSIHNYVTARLRRNQEVRKITAETLRSQSSEKKSQQKREINLLLRVLCASAVRFSE